MWDYTFLPFKFREMMKFLWPFGSFDWRGPPITRQLHVMDGLVLWELIGNAWPQKGTRQKSGFAEGGQQERYVVIVIKAAGCLVESMERGPSRTWV
jgi:hypothetical protein